MLFFKPNSASAVPIYLQLVGQVKHLIETGALRPGDQLPGIRKVSEDLVMNPNTVAKAWRELEHEHVVEMRKGLGVFVTANGASSGNLIQKAKPVLRAAIDRLTAMGLGEEQMRRLFESEMTRLRSDEED